MKTIICIFTFIIGVFSPTVLYADSVHVQSMQLTPIENKVGKTPIAQSMDGQKVQWKTTGVTTSQKVPKKDSQKTINEKLLLYTIDETAKNDIHKSKTVDDEYVVSKITEEDADISFSIPPNTQLQTTHNRLSGQVEERSNKTTNLEKSSSSELVEESQNITFENVEHFPSKRKR